MTFQTETTAVSGVCFSPDKHKRLQKFSKESTSCVITDIIRNKETEFRLTDFSIIKPKTVVFAKKEEQKISSIVQIINEIEPMEFVSVKMKVLSAADLKAVNSLKLREYVATDDGESFINITIFEELIDKVDIDMMYSFFNLQVVTYNNQKKLRSTTLTTVNKQQNALSQINISSTDLLSTEETKEMTFDNIDDESLISQLVCPKCNTSIPSTPQKIVKCIACNSIQLVSSCQTDLS